jgi:hypothetical protein
MRDAVSWKVESEEGAAQVYQRDLSSLSASGPGLIKREGGGRSLCQVGGASDFLRTAQIGRCQ